MRATQEVLQGIDLTYEIAIKTSVGALEPIKKTVTLPVVANLALHQSNLIPLTASELGLANMGDATVMKADVKVEADIMTDKGRKVFASTGTVEAPMQLEEGGLLRSGTSSAK